MVKLKNTGFTLLEVMIAVMILAICLVVVMQLFSGALKAEKKSEEYTRAILIAREKMEEILLMKKLKEGETRGDYNEKYSWIVNINALPGDIKMSSGIKKIFKIDLHILWGKDFIKKDFTINTISISGVLK